MKKLLRRSTAIAALVVAVGLAGSTGLRAQSAPGRLPPQQKDYDKNQQTDYDNAERLHILFSEVPYDYCRTPAVVQAIATITTEIKLVTDELVNDSFHGYINAGKEEEYRSLERILDRLRLNRQRLTGLPSCDTAFRTVFANGIFLGIYVIKTSGRVFITERFIPTDRISNDFSDWHDPLGVGFNVGYAFTPWNNSLVVSPFVSFDYLNNSVNHSFAGGSFLGSTANASGTAGVKIGPSLTRDFWLYGIAGVSRPQRDPERQLPAGDQFGEQDCCRWHPRRRLRLQARLLAKSRTPGVAVRRISPQLVAGRAVQFAGGIASLQLELSPRRRCGEARLQRPFRRAAASARAIEHAGQGAAVAVVWINKSSKGSVWRLRNRTPRSAPDANKALVNARYRSLIQFEPCGGRAVRN
jgi:hypothetical protein